MLGTIPNGLVCALDCRAGEFSATSLTRSPPPQPITTRSYALALVTKLNGRFWMFRVCDARSPVSRRVSPSEMRRSSVR